MDVLQIIQMLVCSGATLILYLSELRKFQKTQSIKIKNLMYEQVKNTHGKNSWEKM
jgi:hypothetical protein